MPTNPPQGAVLCGTDFSPLACETARLTARLAERQGAVLHLIHVVEHPNAGALQRIEEEAASLVGQVRPEALTGLPDEVLSRRARELGASLLTVGSLGRRSLSDFLLGSTADRLIRTCPAPCLVVREPERLAQWLDGKRPLEVLLAYCPDHASQSALSFARGLAGLGPVKLLAVQVAGGPNLDQEWLEEETNRLQAATGLSREECLVELGIWPVEEHLLQRASVRQSDLVVLGSHQRAGLERFWKGSVATAVVHRAPISVACIPDAVVPAGAAS